MGALSYSTYMLHAPIASKFETLLNVLHLHKAGIWAGDLIVIVYIAVVIAASIFTYYCIEMPGRNYFRRLARHKVST